MIPEINQKTQEGGLPIRDLFSIHVGDKVFVRVITENAGCPAGDYEFVVCREDGHSFAVPSTTPWWFHRSDGRSYVGDAQILLNDERMHHYQRRRTSITGLVL